MLYVFSFLFNYICGFSLHDFKSIERAMLGEPFPSNNRRIVIRQSGPGFESVQIKEISPFSSSEENFDLELPKLIDPSPLIKGRLFNVRPKMIVIRKNHLKGSTIPRNVFDSLGEEKNEESEVEEKEKDHKNVINWKKVGTFFGTIIKDFFSFDKHQKKNATESMKIKIVDYQQTNDTNRTRIKDSTNNSNIFESRNSTATKKIKSENKSQTPQVGVTFNSTSSGPVIEKKSNSFVFVLFCIVIFFIILLIIRHILSKEHQAEDSNIFSINSNDDEVRRAKLNKLK